MMTELFLHTLLNSLLLYNLLKLVPEPLKSSMMSRSVAKNEIG